MKNLNQQIRSPIFLLFAWVLLAAASPLARAGLVFNGGFETGLNGWVTANQVGSEGTFSQQTGVVSPILGMGVPAPPVGLRAAMSDAPGPGSHVLYQDIVIPAGFGPAVVSFNLFVGNRADRFANPATVGLDFSTALNQQARVDILRAGTDPFSVAPADVLTNLYRTNVGDPLVSGYNSFNIYVPTLFDANPGQTLRLRFAEVDNLDVFQFGVDNVDINAVPEPSTWLLCSSSLLVMLVIRTRKRLVTKLQLGNAVLEAPASSLLTNSPRDQACVSR